METSIILIYETADQVIEKVRKITEEIYSSYSPYEIIAVLPELSSEDKQNLDALEFSHPLFTYTEVRQNVGFHKRANIARHLVSSSSKHLLFVDYNTHLTNQMYEDRIKPVKLDPKFCIVGEVNNLINSTDKEFMVKYLRSRLWKFIRASDEAFNKKCLFTNGSPKVVKPTTFSVKLNMWDTIGGYADNSEFPHEEFCIRVISMAYEIIFQGDRHLDLTPNTLT